MDTSTLEKHQKYTRDELTDSTYYNAVFDYLKDKEIKVSVDAGACTGEYTRVLRERVPSLETCILIEPIKENVAFIKSMINNVIVIDRALMYGQTSVQFGRFHNVGGSSVFLKENVEVCGTITLENIFWDIDFLKLDIEGLERNIIENSKRIQEIPYIEIEFHHYDEELQHAHNRVPYLTKWLPKHHVVFLGMDMGKDSSIFLSL